MEEEVRPSSRTSTGRQPTGVSLEGNVDDEDFEEEDSAFASTSLYTDNHRPLGRIKYNVARHSDPGGCTADNCTMPCYKTRCYSMESSENLQSFRSRLICPPKLFFPVTPQIRYVSERVVEVFTANAKGRIELHHILHPNMPRHVHDKIEALDLTDGLSRHRITARDVVDRTPFSVYGTFHGRIAIVRAQCTSGIENLTSHEILRGEHPVVATRINQLDNSLLAATDFQSVSAQCSLLVLDLISQSKNSIEPRHVFNASTHSNMLDVCWLWDHPAHLLLSTSDSIRLFDIRCPNRTDQALFLNRGVTHMASNRYRTHIFAGFNDDEIHIYDSRQLFGPIQQIKVHLDGFNGLNTLRWNPYMPYELLLHFRDSPRILRCNVHELGFDPFRRKVSETFDIDDVFSMEQIWEGGLSSKVVGRRKMIYNSVDNNYELLCYGEMYDSCKEDPNAPMPLCWMTPASERAFYVDEQGCRRSGEKVADNRSPSVRLRRANTSLEAHDTFSQISALNRIYSDSMLNEKALRVKPKLNSPGAQHVLALPVQANSPMELVGAHRFPRLAAQSSIYQRMYEKTRSKLIRRLSISHDNLSKDNEVMRHLVYQAELEHKWKSSTLLDRTADECVVDNDQTPVPEPVAARHTNQESSSYRASNKEIENNVGTTREADCEAEFEMSCKAHKDSLSSIFDRLGLNWNDPRALTESRSDVMLKNSQTEEPSDCYIHRTYPQDSCESVTSKKVDNGYRIKLQHKILSFDIAPIGYSGVLCLVERPVGRPKFIFAPFIAPDEGFSIKPELVKVFQEIRMWEAFDSIPYNLYQTMKSRLHNGMDKITDREPFLSILQGLAERIPRRCMQWLLSSARKQPCYHESPELSDFDYTTSDGDEPSSLDKTSLSSGGCSYVPNLTVKGLPGILQLCSLETEKEVSWQDCDSTHFTFVKIARSPIRRMILEPFCLPVTEDKVVSDEKFAASMDILKQIPVIYLCLINGDTIRFIEYTLFIRHKLGKPIFTNNPCSFLNAFYFFSTIVSRYVNKISCATNKSTPNYVARRLRLADKIEAFIKEHSESRLLNPLFVPMMLILLGELTATNPETFTKIVLESPIMPLGLKVAWCTNLLSSAKMKEAFHYLFEKSLGLDRLLFVGLGRHPDSLHVLSEFLYTTQDCQVFSHLLVAGHCLEEDDQVLDESESDDCSKSELDVESVKGLYGASLPSLFAMFPRSYLSVAEDMADFSHLARAELCRYSFILQRMERFCFRRKLLNIVPHIYWPDFKTTVDISCTFCGSSYETALRNAESLISDQISQGRLRPTVTRSATSRSSGSVSSNMASLSLSFSGLSDSETNAMAVTPSSESYYDYNGVDGGTEAEIKRPPDSACPQCRKSYPRCSLCGLSYGTPVNDYDHPAGTFSMMFSTCLMCSHGGHTKHVITWFEKEDECPVLGCDCRCLYLENGISGRIRQRIMTPF
ncbi:hypothetical protein V3C99_017354 [Haemonchus contortus]|nr:WD repeat-containing protein mio [Haemonchus contortus]